MDYNPQSDTDSSTCGLNFNLSPQRHTEVVPVFEPVVAVQEAVVLWLGQVVFANELKRHTVFYNNDLPENYNEEPTSDQDSYITPPPRPRRRIKVRFQSVGKLPPRFYFNPEKE